VYLSGVVDILGNIDRYYRQKLSLSQDVKLADILELIKNGICLPEIQT
jgi:hypothetical protein